MVNWLNSLWAGKFLCCCWPGNALLIDVNESINNKCAECMFHIYKHSYLVYSFTSTKRGKIALEIAANVASVNTEILIESRIRTS